MNRSELLDELSSDVLAYVMRGSFPERHFVDEVKPNGLDDRFSDFESLVRLHFVLRPDVVEFVEGLPRHLREVKTQTENVTNTVRGRIDGRINWSATVRERCSRNPRDPSLFVCENRSENYDIDENLVLKKLLAIVYSTLNDCRTYLDAGYDWVTDRWKENLELVDTLVDIFERNVHVTRIREPKEYEPTPRMLQRAAESRSDLYRTAARLLEEYQRSLDADQEAIRDLLQGTAITPDDDETLFELFVLFKYIDAIEELSESRFELRTIESGAQEVARMTDGEAEIVLYHDSAGDRELSFSTAPDGDDPERYSRREMVEHETLEVAKQYFGTEKLRHVTGRPDVIVLEVIGEQRREYLITEVKHSTRMETIRTGISETLEYLAFLKQNSEFVNNRPDYFGSGWNGVLVIQDLDEETAPLGEQRSMKILQASEVESKLRQVLENVLGGTSHTV